MKRHFFALLGATAGFSYLLSLTTLFLREMLAFLSGTERSPSAALALANAMLDGTYDLIVYALPILLCAALAARFLTRHPHQPLWKTAVIGALLGGILAVSDTFWSRFVVAETRILVGVAGFVAGGLGGLGYGFLAGKQQRARQNATEKFLRVARAAAVATLAAPFLTGTLWLLAEFEFVIGGRWTKDFLFITNRLAQATATAVNVTAVTLFPIALLAALIGAWMGWRSRWIYLFGGAVLACMPIYVLAEMFPGSERKLLLTLVGTMIPSGAICGWIYWRIAIGRPSKAAHAIAQQ
ncbi:hypothetical protein [Microvirga terricola]|uniref:DUF4386 family protein n=1 Tax=Microvirga terricola TaxID=2719797 RepID=A0ABX0VAE1_9HYPH|nr:hypothetical protein [Microvirga terricola]NIX75361.1 hypothetical protein [Microvirga terricola]